MRLNAWKMKPIWRFRIRARCDGVSCATGSPARVYSPSVGVSSRARRESRVVLPHPDGPAIATYSPGCTSRWMSWSACVSTSSVKKIFFSPASRISGWLPSPVIVPEERGEGDCLAADSGMEGGGRGLGSEVGEGNGLLELHATRGVPVRHVGNDHAVADGEAVHDLDGVHGGAAELHVRAIGEAGAFLDPEEADCALGLP